MSQERTVASNLSYSRVVEMISDRLIAQVHKTSAIETNNTGT